MKETSPAISEEMKEGHRGLALSWSAANLSSEKQILQVGLKRASNTKHGYYKTTPLYKAH